MKFEYVTYIAASAEKVWDALVNPDVVEEYYLCPMSEIDLRVDGKISYGGGMISGEITELTRGAVLAHTFKFGHAEDEPETKLLINSKRWGRSLRCH